MDNKGQATAYPVIQRRPRHLAGLAGVLSLIVLLILVHISKYDSAAVQYAQSNIQQIPRPFAHLHNPFRQQVHPPPVQANSTWGEASWFSDWKWLNPFSSTITLDEDRALLPPLPERPPIYTYYAARDEKFDLPLKKAEDQLLEIWRRAWWAQGFKPVVLGPPEAMENPLYQKLMAINTTQPVENELMRWLAWDHMGDGILANWLVLPMANYYASLLVYLRAARYSEIMRYHDLGLGLFVGAKRDIDHVLNALLDAPSVKTDNSLLETIEKRDEKDELFHTEVRGRGLAFYSSDVISSKYTDVADVMSSSQVKGLEMLAELITGHLHATFLSHYPDGLAVVSPYAGNATLLTHRALTLAKALNTCPSDPVAPNSGKTPSKLSTCPPNLKDCTPCNPVPIKFPSSAPNSATTFAIGTVPHTYTLTRLLAPHQASFNFTVGYIRRHTQRDPWVEAVTTETSKKGTSAYQRIVSFKEEVAQPGKGAMRSIWRTAESDWSWTGIEWRLGFALPRPPMPDVSDKLGNPVPAERIPPLDMGVGEKYPEILEDLLKAMREKPLRSDLVEQAQIIKETGEKLVEKKWMGSGRQLAEGEQDPDLRRVSEAWHLADAEAWRFVRALTARETVERKRWMEEEGKFRH